MSRFTIKRSSRREKVISLIVFILIKNWVASLGSSRRGTSPFSTDSCVQRRWTKGSVEKEKVPLLRSCETSSLAQSSNYESETPSWCLEVSEASVVQRHHHHHCHRLCHPLPASTGSPAMAHLARLIPAAPSPPPPPPAAAALALAPRPRRQASPCTLPSSARAPPEVSVRPSSTPAPCQLSRWRRSRRLLRELLRDCRCLSRVAHLTRLRISRMAGCGCAIEFTRRESGGAFDKSHIQEWPVAAVSGDAARPVV
jgi:hypothetical protein